MSYHDGQSYTEWNHIRNYNVMTDHQKEEEEGVRSERYACFFLSR